MISRSRFIAYSAAVSSHDCARDEINALRKRHPDCTHICYGYICDILGNERRFSDDGEPHGTAGRPILDIIAANNLRLTLIAVVRYYGGIKLGTGGLTRAYSACASECLTASGTVKYVLCRRFSINFSFQDFSRLSRAITGYIIDAEYGDTVRASFAVEQKAYDALIAGICEQLQKRIDVTEFEPAYMPEKTG